jgi:hypothetical protein
MQDSNIPTKYAHVFGSSATYIRTVSDGSNIGVSGKAGWASFVDGFPPLTQQPVGSGGIPPWIQDFNGLLNVMTAWQQWQQAGGPITYDSAFQSSVGGYPKGCVVQSATIFGQSWISTTDNNTTNPDSGGAGWVSTTLSVPAYALDTSGTVNNIVASLSPATTGGLIAGNTIRIKIANTSTGSCSLNLNGLGTHTIYNPDGSGITAGQLVAGGVFEFTFDGSNWQLLSRATSHGSMQFAAYASSTSWTCPVGVTTAMVRCRGGGGGGGGNSYYPGGGGGEGGTVWGVVTVSPGTAYVITIGAAGIANTLGYSGNSGGTTSFSSLISATGGGGGQGGSGFISAGGAGGSGTGSALIQGGQYGSDAPQNASNNNETGGNGGGTGNGRGATGYANGLPAIGYGGGGGGGGASGTGVGATGGNGFGGYCTVEWVQ